MILVLRQDCTREEVAYAEKRLKELGLEPHTLFGVERTVIAAIGDERKTSVDQLSQIPGVDTVMPILAPYKLASKESHPTTSVFEIGGECDAGASTALDNCGAGGSSALVSCGARGSPALGATQPPLKPAPRRSWCRRLACTNLFHVLTVPTPGSAPPRAAPPPQSSPSPRRPPSSQSPPASSRSDSSRAAAIPPEEAASLPTFSPRPTPSATPARAPFPA